MNAVRSFAAAVLGLGLWALPGCSVPRQMLAAPDDLSEYRAFRAAAHEGARLAAAQRYLEHHPRGAWADEVRLVFDAEEAAWFEAAKTSRSRAREYVVDLPTGPHSDAARALLVLFDEHQGDVETLTLLAEARRTAATLDIESARRRHVGELVLAEIAALLDPRAWGAPLDAPPAPLASVLRGEVPPTWGGATHARRQDALFFVLPTPQGSQARVLEVTLQLWLEHGRIAQGIIQGDDLFARWTEATLTRIVDPTSASDRELVRATVTDLVSGALEATLPADSCAVPPRDGELLARSCDGWTLSMRVGTAEGEMDAIDVRGPAR
ncbi:MAG TPA: hypothetical protein VIF15_00835 [Polyangiaceae bacterium]|jgi:hypothetical protein